MKKYKSTIIGRKIKVINSKNKSNEGIHGMVLDETRNMVIVETSLGKKMIIKSENQFDLNGNIIAGTSLIGRPEDRVKL